MPLDELWAPHQSVPPILASRLETQKSELEDRLRRLAVAPLEDPSRHRSPAANHALAALSDIKLAEVQTFLAINA